MSKESVKISFKQFDEIQLILEQFKNLKIDWETDLEKMNFSLLRSNPNCDIKKSCIEKLDLTKTRHWETCKSDFGRMVRDEATRDLIEFVSKGNKIIPPLYVKPFEYDGETYSTKECSELRQADGEHRLFLSAAMGLEEIPIIIHEKIWKYYFPLSKWNYELMDESLITKSKDGNHIFEFDFNRIHIYEELFHENTITVVPD